MLENNTSEREGTVTAELNTATAAGKKALEDSSSIRRDL